MKCKHSLQIALSAHVAGLVLAPRLPSAPRRMPRLVTWTGFPTLLAVWWGGAGPVTDGKRSIFKSAIFCTFKTCLFGGRKTRITCPEHFSYCPRAPCPGPSQHPPPVAAPSRARQHQKCPKCKKNQITPPHDKTSPYSDYSRPLPEIILGGKRCALYWRWETSAGTLEPGG